MASVHYMKTLTSTVECYNEWANTYDSDGNILQLLDDDAFNEVAQPFLNLIDPDSSTRICCELGCGTGRNTMKILSARWIAIAVDASTGMMSKAQERVQQSKEFSASPISWILHDLNGSAELSIDDSSVDAVISTLVVEHVESLDRFFQIIYRILKKKKNSWAFITAMHPNMYKAGSQAGFILDQASGRKLCGISYDHSIESIIEMARKNKLVLKYHTEKRVENEEHAKRLGTRANKWIGMDIHVSFLFQIQN